MSPTEALRGFTLIACECKLIGFRSWRLWQTFTYGYESHGSIFEIALDCKFAIMTSVRTESPPKKIFTRHFLSSWQQIYIREKVGSVPVATPPPKKKKQLYETSKIFLQWFECLSSPLPKIFFWKRRWQTFPSPKIKVLLFCCLLVDRANSNASLGSIWPFDEIFALADREPCISVV